MKATFFERVGAYILDMFVISIIIGIIGLGFKDYTNSAEKKMQELDNKLLESTIIPQENLDEYKTVLYEYQKENVLQSGISVAITIAYFVVFQYMNKGQTIGKKILNIRVVDKDNKKPISILKGLLRSFLVFSILSGTICILLLYVLDSSNYINAYVALLMLEGLFTLITIMFVLYRKDGRGLHDMMANTIVIKESR